MEVQKIKADYKFSSDEIACIAHEIATHRKEVEEKVSDHKEATQVHKAEVGEITEEIEKKWDMIEGGVELREYDAIKVIDEKEKKIKFFQATEAGKKTKVLLTEFDFPSEGYQVSLGDDFDLASYDPFSDFESEIHED